MYVSTDGLTSGLDSIGSSTPADTQKKAVEGLISRLLPLRSHQFNITIDSSIGPANRDTFIVRLNHLIIYISNYMYISTIFFILQIHLSVIYQPLMRYHYSIRMHGAPFSCNLSRDDISAGIVVFIVNYLIFVAPVVIR